MNPMFVSDEKAAAALGMSVESLATEVVQKGLLHEYRDRNRIVFRFEEVKDLLTSLPLDEAVFSDRLAELRLREGPKPGWRSHLTRPEVERILNVRSSDIEDFVRDRLLSSRVLMGQELFPADVVRSLIPRFNPLNGKDLFTKFVESSAAQSARLLLDLRREDQAALEIFEPGLRDEEIGRGIESSKESSGISIFDTDEDISSENLTSLQPIDGDSSTSLDDTGISIFDLGASNENEEIPLLDGSLDDDPSAITRVGFPIIEESGSTVLEAKDVESEEKRQGAGDGLSKDEFERLLDEDEPLSKDVAIGEYANYSERALLAEWKKMGDEPSPDKSALASLVQRLDRSTDPEAATTRKKLLEAFAMRYDKIAADCLKKYPGAFVSAWKHCAEVERGDGAPSFWRSMRLRFASRASEERAARSEIENAVRHASSKARNLVKGYFAMRLYAAAYEK